MPLLFAAAHTARHPCRSIFINYTIETPPPNTLFQPTVSREISEQFYGCWLSSILSVILVFGLSVVV